MFLKTKLKWLCKKVLFLTSTIPCCCICAFCNLGSKSLRYVMMNQSSPQHSLSDLSMVFIISDFWRKQKKVTIHLSPNFSPKPYQTFSTSITERVVLSTFFVTAKCFPRASHDQAAGGRRTSAYYEEDENRSKSLQRLRTSLWEPFMKLSDTDRVLFANGVWFEQKKAFWIQDIESIWF